MAAWLPESEPLLERLCVVPAGLLLLFFGVAILRPTLCIAAALLAARLAFVQSADAGYADALVLTVAVAAGSVAFAFVFAFCEQRGPAGAALGTCIALSMQPAGFAQCTLAVMLLASSFALLTIASERAVFILVTAFGGSYLVWHGLELIDAPTGTPLTQLPAFIFTDNLDLWFSVLSFVTVGFLGCCVQLILVGSQVSTSHIHYDPIP